MRGRSGGRGRSSGGGVNTLGKLFDGAGSKRDVDVTGVTPPRAPGVSDFPDILSVDVLVTVDNDGVVNTSSAVLSGKNCASSIVEVPPTSVNSNRGWTNVCDIGHKSTRSRGNVDNTCWLDDTERSSSLATS